MAKTPKTPKRASGTYTIGREAFAKISAVESIKPNRRMAEDFKEFERQGLSPAECSRELGRKYGVNH